MSATVAGTAPVARIAASEAVATSTFWGYGSPWLMSVDSRATTGVPSAQRVGDLGSDGKVLGADHAPRVRQGSGVGDVARGSRRDPDVP